MLFGLEALLQTAATAQTLQILYMGEVAAAVAHTGQVLWVVAEEMEAFQVVEVAAAVEQTLAAL